MPTHILTDGPAPGRPARVDRISSRHGAGRFLVLAQAEWARHDADGRVLALMLIDIDGCQQVNATHGRQAGDRLVAQVAAACRAMARPGEVLARTQGEQFALLAPNVTARDAADRAEALRLQVCDDPLIVGDTRIGVTVSIGVADSARSDTLAGLINEAEEALYAAKRAGRNRVQQA